MRRDRALRLDPEGHFVELLMDKADLIGHHQLRQGGDGFVCCMRRCAWWKARG